MKRLICTDCDQPIPNGTAKVRSRNLEQRAWHPECYAFSHPDEVEELRIPAPRTGTHDVLRPTRVS